MEVGGQLHFQAAILLGKSCRYPLSRRPQGLCGCGGEEKRSLWCNKLFCEISLWKCELCLAGWDGVQRWFFLRQWCILKVGRKREPYLSNYGVLELMDNPIRRPGCSVPILSFTTEVNPCSIVTTPLSRLSQLF